MRQALERLGPSASHAAPRQERAEEDLSGGNEHRTIRVAHRPWRLWRGKVCVRHVCSLSEASHVYSCSSGKCCTACVFLLMRQVLLMRQERGMAAGRQVYVSCRHVYVLSEGSRRVSPTCVASVGVHTGAFVYGRFVRPHPHAFVYAYAPHVCVHTRVCVCECTYTHTRIRNLAVCVYGGHKGGVRVSTWQVHGKYMPSTCVVVVCQCDACHRVS
jgi:hypothetical protein